MHAGVICADNIELRWIDDIVASRMCGMFAAGAVTFFAGHIPFCNLLCFQIVIQRMAAIAKRTCGPLKITGWIKLCPPIRAVGNVIGKPAIVFDVPLRGQNKIIVAALGEIALLPATAINERNLTEIESDVNGRMREIAEDSFGMFLRIAHHVGHARLLPAFVERFVTFLAIFRADEMGFLFRGGRGRCLRRDWLVLR